MRKKYIAPDMETVKFVLNDVIMYSVPESSIPEIIGGDDDEGGEIEGL